VYRKNRFAACRIEIFEKTTIGQRLAASGNRKNFENSVAHGAGSSLQ
jgi:hypothetical protein